MLTVFSRPYRRNIRRHDLVQANNFMTSFDSLKILQPWKMFRSKASLWRGKLLHFRSKSLTRQHSTHDKQKSFSKEENSINFHCVLNGTVNDICLTVICGTRNLPIFTIKEMYASGMAYISIFQSKTNWQV